MPPHFWTHASLDALRIEGDLLADAVVARLFADGKVEAVNGLMRTLVTNDDLPSSGLPPYVLDYLERAGELPRVDPDRLREAQAVFDLYGPEILVVLGFYSLPASYAARRGVQVLQRTGYLAKHPIRRLFETTQMVVDVMTRGGLEPGGRGIRTAQKVRLMHAAVRHLLLQDPARPWDVEELGLPINQEDMAGTLMTFGHVVLEGLRVLDVNLTRAQQEAWLHAWGVVGHLLGLDPRLVPATVEEAYDLTHLIRERQIAPSPEGVAMTRSLVEALRALLPDLMRGLPASLIHFFLDQDQWRGVNVADLLEVPRPDWTGVIPEGLRHVGHLLGWVDGHTHIAAALLRHVSKDFVAAMLRVQGRGARAAFLIPEELRAQWNLAPEPRPTLRETASQASAALVSVMRQAVTPLTLARKVA